MLLAISDESDFVADFDLSVHFWLFIDYCSTVSFFQYIFAL